MSLADVLNNDVTTDIGTKVINTCTYLLRAQNKQQ